MPLRITCVLLAATALGGCAAFSSKAWNQHGAMPTLSAQAATVLSGWAGEAIPSPPTCPENQANCRIEVDAVIIQGAIAAVGKVDTAGAPGRLRVNRTIALALVMNSDATCERYMTDIIDTDRTTATGLRLSGLLLGAAGGQTTPVRNANLLSAAAALTASTEDTLRKTLLSQNNVNVIYRAVNAERANIRSEIVQYINSGTESGYTLAMARLPSYHATCGITNGINALEQAVDQAQAGANTAGAGRASQALNAQPATVSIPVVAPVTPQAEAGGAPVVPPVVPGPAGGSSPPPAT